jgi:AcrR family transcriptional regulator
MASVPVKALEQEPIQRLPAGSHGIPPELVARNQRERLIAAMAEVCAEKSYAEVSVADVVAGAGVSTATFYKRFEGKRDCMLAAHEELFGRFLAELDVVCAEASDEQEGMREAVRTALEMLAADAPTARLLTVEILALGPEGSERHAAAIEQLAELLQTDWTSAAGIAALVGKLVMAGEGPALPALGDELFAAATASPR